MGQCWAKHRKSKKRATQDKYQPRSSESQQPIVNGGQSHDISQAVSSVSLDRGTQHISERETADVDVNEHPADCATGNSLFLDSSQPDLKQRRKSHYDNHLADSSPVNQLKRSNSCSTIYLHETVSQPNMKNTIKAVALGIYNLIKNRRGRSFYQEPSGGMQFGGLDESDQQMLANLEIFDEMAHPLTVPVSPDYAQRNPEHKTVYRFIRNLFNQAQLNAECAIVTLVYLERLLTYADFELTPANWKRVTLGAIMLASKVWDDQAVWNVDFCSIFKDVSVEDMNALERQFLQILQFNTNVPSSVYAKYYFDLRALADANDLSISIEPLSKEKALKLEAMSIPYKERFNDHNRLKVKRSTSLDGIQTLNRSSIAIIS